MARDLARASGQRLKTFAARAQDEHGWGRGKIALPLTANLNILAQSLLVGLGICVSSLVGTWAESEIIPRPIRLLATWVMSLLPNSCLCVSY